MVVIQASSILLSPASSATAWDFSSAMTHGAENRSRYDSCGPTSLQIQPAGNRHFLRTAGRHGRQTGLWISEGHPVRRWILRRQSRIRTIDERVCCILCYTCELQSVRKNADVARSNSGFALNRQCLFRESQVGNVHWPVSTSGELERGLSSKSRLNITRASNAQ